MNANFNPGHARGRKLDVPATALMAVEEAGQRVPNIGLVMKVVHNAELFEVSKNWTLCFSSVVWRRRFAVVAGSP